MTLLQVNASGDSFVNAASAQLASTHVYVDSGASLASQGQISSSLSGTNVAVAVIPDFLVQQLSPGQLAGQILNSTDGRYETIIVVVDGSTDTVAVASNGDGVAISAAIQSNLNANGGNAGEAILSSLSEVLSSSTVTSTGDGSSSLGAADGGGIGFVGIGGALLATVVIGAVATKFLRKNARKKAENSLVYTNLTAELERELKTFDDIVTLHDRTQDHALSAQLHSIMANIQELFRRMDRKSTEGQKRIAMVEYTDTFAKLNKALGVDYFLDIVKNPSLWDRPQERMSEVRDAVMASDRQILTNIRQVNASQDLDFKVALDSLTRSLSTVTAEDMMRVQDEA